MWALDLLQGWAMSLPSWGLVLLRRTGRKSSDHELHDFDLSTIAGAPPTVWLAKSSSSDLLAAPHTHTHTPFAGTGKP